MIFVKYSRTSPVFRDSFLGNNGASHDLTSHVGEKTEDYLFIASDQSSLLQAQTLYNYVLAWPRIVASEITEQEALSAGPKETADAISQVKKGKSFVLLEKVTFNGSKGAH